MKKHREETYWHILWE